MDFRLRGAIRYMPIAVDGKFRFRLLAGTTIRDAALNDADRTLDAPGTPGSLGANKDIVINSAPVVTNVTSSLANDAYTVLTVVPIQITFNEAVTVTGTPLLALNTVPARSASSTASSS